MFPRRRRGRARAIAVHDPDKRHPILVGENKVPGQELDRHYIRSTFCHETQDTDRNARDMVVTKSNCPATEKEGRRSG